jgi:ferric-dicitrate binding protein FerR (iron transport regulator)
MNRRDEKLLTRHLAGETSHADERELAARLAREPDLAAALERLGSVWSGLELPPTAQAPPGFAEHVRRRALESSGAGETIGPAPLWARVAAAAALVAGVALGAGLGTLEQIDTTDGASTTVAAGGGSLVDDDLGSDAIAGAYLEALAGAASTDGEATR